ncbi:MAG: YdcH family protein [Pseudomonadales bacterium]
MDNAEIQQWLEQLRIEHRDLDEVIHHLLETRHHDTMRIQRLKKRKLKLKDMIAKLESELIPDLDA